MSRWRFSYVDVDLPTRADPRVDWLRDGTHYKVLDVNNDHLVDIVRTTGTVMQTWLNLGFVPDGEGKFGHAVWTDAGYTTSTEPLESCLLWRSTPLDFGDPEVRLADMNGDGIQDIVRMRRGLVVWWPGRGDGLWGDGSPSCARGEGAGRERVMATPPRELNPDLDGVYLADVNQDGTSDVVQVRFRNVDVWFNRGGDSYTERLVLDAPLAPAFAPRVRFTDIDGSGTSDLVYANAGRWQYLDFMGGQRPRLLSSVHNGLGAETTLVYDSSAHDYLLDLQDAESCTDASCERFSWSHVPATGCPARLMQPGDTASSACYRSGGSPVISSVVRAVRTNDHFGSVGANNVDQVGETHFAYHDGYYEGIEQEFRGFGAADAVALGDAHGPTQWTRTHFHQGRRPTWLESDRLADNPREALKGRQWMSEVFDEGDVYASTSHATCVVRKLATGLDGRGIYYGYVSRQDTLLYDDAPFTPDGGVLADVPVVQYQEVGASGTPGPSASMADEVHDVVVRGARWAWTQTTTDEVDNVGNVRLSVAHGRLHDAGDASYVPVAYGEEIRQLSEPLLLNAAGQWIWRTQRAYVNGAVGAPPLGETVNEYDAVTGDLLFARKPANLLGASYEFGAGAQSLALTSQSLEASSRFDAWGSATASCGGADLRAGAAGCLRYSEVDYDGAYGQLPRSERVAVDRSGAGFCTMAAGFCTLSTTAVWDRGFGVLTSATDPSGQTTEVGYDGLGRLSYVKPPVFAGCALGVPAQRFVYELAVGGQPVSYVHAIQNEGNGACTADELLDTYTVVDGLGRTRASVVRAEVNQWVKGGFAHYAKRGAAYQSCNPVAITDTSNTFDLSWAASHEGTSAVCTEQFADAFGRPRVSKERDGIVVADVSYHALSVDTSDALDLAGPMPFTGSPSTERKDGHGRTIESLLRNRQPGQSQSTLEIYRMVTSYRADNAVLSVTRAQTTSDAPLTESQVAAAAVPGPSGRPRLLTRTFTYDSQGRRLGTTDPDSDSREASRTAANRTWRYLYNRVGDLAAVRDPRGCGQDFYYDYAGRLLAEDYIGCGESQLLGDDPDELLPSGAIGLGVMTTSPPVDVRYFFDAAPWYYSTMSGPSVSPAPPAADYPLGRLTGTSDRGQRASVRYDARGQVSWTGRQMALVPDAAAVPGQLTDPPAAAAEGPLTPAPRSFDEAHTYALSPEYDHLGRQVAMTLPLDPDWETLGGTGPAPSVRGHVTLGRRGLPERMDVTLGGASYTILDRARYWPDGQPHIMHWGDSLGSRTLPGAPLRQVWTYDLRLRTYHNYMIHTPLVTPLPGETPLDGVRIIQNYYYTYDAANNLKLSQDVRERGAWAAGHHGRRQSVSYDALYRITKVNNLYASTSPAWQTQDVATDWRTTRDDTRSADPMRTNPATMLPAPPPDRAVQFLYEYDWLGNMVEWTDDAGAFYERSLGAQGQIGNGFDDPAYVASLPRPGALYFSSNVRDFDGTADVLVDRGGWLDVSYGEDGNATGLTVRARCHDADATTSCWDDTTQDYASRAAQLRTRCVCAEEQHYEYRWDELNRLSEARRYDRHGAGMWELGVRQRMRYDGANQRTVKVVSDDADVVTGGALPERATLYVYPGDYERRGVVRDPISGTYEASLALGTESQYLVGGARITWKHGTPAAGIDRDARISMTFTDMLGSSTAVVDLVSGSLMEAGMYYPSGARETRVVNQTATFSLEPTGFTGKEENEEVGLTYFGERYLIPRLARWASPDPLQIHAMSGGEAMNSYHYVAGNLLQATDPDGLGPTDEQLNLAADQLDAGPDQPSSEWTEFVPDEEFLKMAADLASGWDGPVTANDLRPFIFAYQREGDDITILRFNDAEGWQRWPPPGSNGDVDVMMGLASLARGLAGRAASVALRDVMRLAADERGVLTLGGSLESLMRRVRVLGTDPSTGFRASEGLAGVRLERELGRQIRRSADDSSDLGAAEARSSGA